MPTFVNRPVFCWDNFLDFVYANPSAGAPSFDGTQEQVESLGAGRRNRNPTPWAPGTGANLQITVDLGVGVLKAANVVWLDKGHNYFGEEVRLAWADTVGGAYTNLVVGDVGTDGVDLDDGSWLLLFEGTEVSKRFWRVIFTNGGAIDLNVPGLWFGRMEQFASYIQSPADEDAGEIFSVGQETSDRGVSSAAAAQTLIHRMEVRIEHTDSPSNEYTSLLRPWQLHVATGGLTLAGIDWVNGPEKIRLYRMAGDQVGGPFRIRGLHDFNLTLREVL